MTEGVRTTRVTVLDEPFAIRSEAPPDYTRRVAAHVDTTLRALRQATPTLEPFPMAVLGAMEITNDLFRLRGELTAVAEDAITRIGRWTEAIDGTLEREVEVTEDDAR